MSKINMRYMPSPNPEYVVNLDRLDGGLNIHDLPFRLKNDESPEMRNLVWRDGVLCSRDGQEWIIKDDPGDVIGSDMYNRLFNGFLVAKRKVGAKTELYYTDPKADTPEWIQLTTDSGLSSLREGTFFHYFDSLYYKVRGSYIKIDYDSEANTLSAAPVEGYVPVTVINASPVNGGGTLYQPENRIQSKKTVRYNAESGVSAYHLPIAPVDAVVSVVVDGVSLTEGTDYTVDLANGVVNFTVAPSVTNPPTNNTVEITYSKSNPDAYNSIMSCRYAETYGGTGDLCVVMGGCQAQPNAIFWNGNNIAMDPTYFPFDQYQLIGDSDNPVTGFGKQQSFLVVFQRNSVGRVKQDLTTVDGRVVVDMPYVAINNKIGCDCPKTIQLVENNLVWANREQGVHILKDSSYAYENNIECISLKVNGVIGAPGREGLLAALASGKITSLDDGHKYWVEDYNEGKVWVWDYENTSYKEPSWYYFTNIYIESFASDQDDIWGLSRFGGLSHFVRNYKDFDGPIDKSYRFATQYFGGYDRLKNVNSVIITVRPDTDSNSTLTYYSDYETRVDQTNLVRLLWHLVPRDLRYRSLSLFTFGVWVFRRRPMCRRVRHFTMRLDNNIAGQDLSIVSAQIFYNYQGRLR